MSRQFAIFSGTILLMDFYVDSSCQTGPIRGDGHFVAISAPLLNALFPVTTSKRDQGRLPFNFVAMYLWAHRCHYLEP